MIFYRFLYTDTAVLADKQNIYIHQLCVDTGWHLEDLPIEMNGKGEENESMLSVCYDDK